MKKYDVLVVGAGHAGVEASLAAARMGMKTAVFTISLDNIARMSCNPSVGGPAKGHLVKEIDALGGEMARNIDKSYLQIRVLNTKKGPAVRAYRAQADKHLYHIEAKKTLENQENLDVIQGLVSEIIVKDGKIRGIKIKEGVEYSAETVIIATGTFMRGVIHIGDNKFEGGRMGEQSSKDLPLSLEKHGIKLFRFKTGTPPRVNKLSVDYSELIEQRGDDKPLAFSNRTDREEVEGRTQLSCYLTHTNKKVHEHIKENMHRASNMNGGVNSKGPRYCPSVEVKIDRFADKDRHQVFLEPEGYNTNEIYLNGLSTSLPVDVQDKILSNIPGLENSQVMRYGYIVEYDYVDLNEMKYNLESHKIEGLFFAGQINGTTGYEEAAATGLMAGINASLKIRGREPLVLSRNSSYIGLMIDDLITKGACEPYRVLTARAEYRLILRYDNADIRLSKIGYELGLLTERDYDKVRSKIKSCEDIRQILKKKHVSMHDTKVRELLESKGESIKSGISLENLLKRTSFSYNDIKKISDIPNLDEEIEFHIETEVKYEGYVDIQKNMIEKHSRLEGRKIPENFDFNSVQNISTESKEKLSLIKPENIGQASRISGVNPSDISFLIMYLEKNYQNV